MGHHGKSEQSFIFAIRYQIKKVPDQKDRVGHPGGREEAGNGFSSTIA